MPGVDGRASVAASRSPAASTGAVAARGAGRCCGDRGRGRPQIGLAQDGKLSLDDTVQRWLPGLLRGYGTQITIRELMTDSSGGSGNGNHGYVSYDDTGDHVAVLLLNRDSVDAAAAAGRLYRGA